MTPRKKRLTSAQVIKILTGNGFVDVSQKGSHKKFFNMFTRKTVIVPMHRGELKLGTLQAIEKQSGLLFL